MLPAPTPRCWTLVLLAAALVLPGAKCGQTTFNTIQILEPTAELLSDDPSLDVLAQIASTFDPASVEVLLEGVDLVAALGLVPPFSDASGVALVGGEPVTITGFTYDPGVGGVRKELRLTLSALPPAYYTLEIRGERSADASVVSRIRLFSQVGAFSQVLSGFPASGSSGINFGLTGPRGAASLGDAFAAPPVAALGVGELAPGFVAAAEKLSH